MNAERNDHPEKPNESVVERNFRMLVRHVKSPDTAESIGGNASKVTIGDEPWGCYAINGVIDTRTGEVLEYGNFAQATEPHEEEFAIIIGVPPVKLLLKGASDVIVDILPHAHHQLSPGSVDTLMRMKPLWDAHSAATTIKEMATHAAPAAPTPDAPVTEAVNSTPFMDRLRKLFGR